MERKSDEKSTRWGDVDNKKSPYRRMIYTTIRTVRFDWYRVLVLGVHKSRTALGKKIKVKVRFTRKHYRCSFREFLLQVYAYKNQKSRIFRKFFIFL